MGDETVEREFVEAELRAVSPLTTGVPRKAPVFIDWFETLRESGPGQRDSLFPWLAESATMAQMRWFLRQEAAGEAGFEDLVALTQVRVATGPKLEMARNYWDEMGRGHERGMHGPMLARLVVQLGLDPTPETTVWEALALSNLMTALASSREFAYHSIGALGVIEMTAPGRVTMINQGLERLSVDLEGRKYFALHAGLDVHHSRSWNREVIKPLVEANPDVAMAIAEGALMRLASGARCFARYRKHFGLSADRERLTPQFEAGHPRPPGTNSRAAIVHADRAR